MKKSIADIDFDFYSYYVNKLTGQGAKTTFKYIVCNKLRVDPRTFEKWVQRKDIPGGSIQIQMIAIILDSNNELPNYK